MPAPDYDVLVLGGGSAGSAAAAEAAKSGARTAMVNDGELGGLCILRGCMPTKALLATAHAVHEATHLESFGARLEGRVHVDFPAAMARKDEQVERFKRAKVRSIENGGYAVLPGRVRFAEGGGVDVGGKRLTAGGYVIATGSVPVRLPVPGIDDVPVLTSDDVMRLHAAPSSLIVQGAGPIGLELAQFFARIGTEVLLVNRSPLLGRLDADAGEELTRALEREPNLELAVPGKLESLAAVGTGLEAVVRCGDRVRRHRADALLVAVGRRAALDSLGLEHVGLEPSAGRLAHDRRMRTGHPGVYVAGDATGSWQILHLGNQEGRVAGHNAAGAQPPREMDYRLAMQVIFTDPPFAQVGATAEQAARDGREPVTGAARFAETGRAITMGVQHGIWKLVADRASGEILGSSILGPRADDLIHVVSTLMHHGATLNDVEALPWYHPTLAEVMIDLARDLRGRIG